MKDRTLRRGDRQEFSHSMTMLPTGTAPRKTRLSMQLAWRSLLANPWLPVALLFFLCSLRSIGLPGLYMDEVNPDYLAARVLHPALHNPVFELPTRFFNILGNYYHGVQNYYLAIPVLSFLGSSVTSIRLAHVLFGLIIVACTTKIVSRLTRSGALALACGLATATDMAFIGSFRDQNYIVLGGFAWLMVALLLLLPGPRFEESDAGLSNRRVFVSGLFCGLAAYGYFVQLFFYPAMLLITLRQAASRKRAAVFWCLGVAAGVTPYALGYLSMYLAVGGLHQLAQSIHSGLTTLQPLQEGSGPLKNLTAVFGFANMAVTNHENEMMTLGASLHSTWGNAKFYLLIFSILAALASLAVSLLRRRKDHLDLMLVSLPLSYLVVASIFGGRLGSHHFALLTPLTYLLLALLLGRLVSLTRKTENRRPGNMLIVSFTVLVVGANLVQQHQYFNELERTGGAGRSSNALTTMADQALSTGQHAVYAFPEWGFFMSFVLLTQNRVPYLLDISPTSLAAAHAAYADRPEVRLLYWNQKDRDSYRAALAAQGISAISETDFMQRDGREAFHMLTGHFADTTAAKNVNDK
jgi:hypothetical protein